MRRVYHSLAVTPYCNFNILMMSYRGHFLRAGVQSDARSCPQCSDPPDLGEVLGGGLGHVDGVVQGDHVGLAVDPQHRGGDVLSQVTLWHKHNEGEIRDKTPSRSK